jgi:hypothetical protein
MRCMRIESIKIFQQKSHLFRGLYMQNLISGKLYILDMLRARLVHNPEMNTETIITIIGFLGAILLLLDVVVIR